MNAVKLSTEARLLKSQLVGLRIAILRTQITVLELGEDEIHEAIENVSELLRLRLEHLARRTCVPEVVL